MNLEIANEKWRWPGKPNSQNFLPNRMSVFQICAIILSEKNKMSARISWSHNGVNIGTTLLYVVTFTVISVGLSHFLELVSSTRRLVCVCVCVCAISFSSWVFDPMFPGAPFLTLHYRTLRILNDQQGMTYRKSEPHPPPSPINHIRSYLTICLSITHSQIFFGN